jgi:hypothetical protein
MPGKRITGIPLKRAHGFANGWYQSAYLRGVGQLQDKQLEVAGGVGSEAACLVGGSLFVGEVAEQRSSILGNAWGVRRLRKELCTVL